MADEKGKKGTADIAHLADLVREEFKPSFRWIEDPKCHYLQLDLPGFRKQQIKVQIDNMGHVNIKGEKQASNNSYIFFNQSYKIPDNSTIQQTTARLQNGLLTVTIPKQVIQATSEIYREMFHNWMLYKYREGKSMMRTPMQMISKNKGIVTTAVLAFSLGFLVARFAESGRP